MLLHHTQLTVSEHFAHYMNESGEVFERKRELFNGKTLIERAIRNIDGEWLKFAHYQDRPPGKPISGGGFQKYIQCFANEVMERCES